MSTPELDEIIATVETAIRKAYVQGRTDALKKMVQMLQDDKSGFKPLALAPPQSGTEPPPEPKPVRLGYTGLPLREPAANDEYMADNSEKGTIRHALRDYFSRG